MDFSLSEEQLQLKDSARRFIAREYSPLQHRALVNSEAGYSESIWSLMCELGWAGLSIPAAKGGHGGSTIDLMLLCETLGRAPILEPYLPNLFSAQILSGCDTGLSASALADIMSGARKVSTALFEPGSRYSLNCSNSWAERSEDGYVLNGKKTAVPFAEVSDKIIVAAQISESNSPGTFALLLVDSATTGVNIHGYRTLDGQQAADVVFEEVMLPTEACLIQGQAARGLLSNALDSQLIGLSAEALGCMEAALDMTVAYCKERQQFGQAIGKFQAIQHKLADMFILCQGIRSLLYAAAIETVTKSV